VQFIARYFGDLNGKRVADIGAGKGRFARVLKQQNPDASLVAFDLAEAMLRIVDGGVVPCCGSMTALPFASGIFDAAYATESLEHAVDIKAAVSEMCRVLKPGGKLVIIDKNAEHWGKLETPAWEKWFGRKELETMLKRHCSHVESEFISYWEDVPPDGMFLAWKAIL
jgi:ubiquinone/menaquinone biosynthesis C-methylase UbiE